jgi:hypothetical protein
LSIRWSSIRRRFHPNIPSLIPRHIHPKSLPNTPAKVNSIHRSLRKIPSCLLIDSQSNFLYNIDGVGPASKFRLKNLEQGTFLNSIFQFSTI